MHVLPYYAYKMYTIFENTIYIVKTAKKTIPVHLKGMFHLGIRKNIKMQMENTVLTL